MTGTEAWVLARETSPTSSLVPTGLPVEPGRPVTIGRHGEVPLGADLPDEGISRVAMTVTAGAGGWTIEVRNRNGALLCPWGLAPQRALATQVVPWPLVAVRISGTQQDQQHWVLLENDAYPAAADDDEATGETWLGTQPPPLAPAERAALRVTFHDFLVWPPPTTPFQPQQLKQAATRLGKSLSGVQDRLRSAMDKALRLGLPAPTTLTNPDYLHVLVAAGYLTPDPGRPYRRTVTEDRTSRSAPR